jgi:hypothetical protein
VQQAARNAAKASRDAPMAGLDSITTQEQSEYFLPEQKPVNQARSSGIVDAALLLSSPED